MYIFYSLTAKKLAKCIIFQVGAFIKNKAALQCKVGILCFTSFQELYFRKLILIFWISFIWIFENQGFNGSRICCRYHEQQSQLTKSFLGLLLNLKRTVYIQYASTSKFFKLTISANLALQHVTEAFPDMRTSRILPHKFQRTNVKLEIT